MKKTLWDTFIPDGIYVSDFDRFVESLKPHTLEVVETTTVSGSLGSFRGLPVFFSKFLSANKAFLVIDGEITEFEI